MTETPLHRAPRSRRQVLRAFVALGLLPSGALVAGSGVRARAKPPKFRLVTRRFTIVGPSAGGGNCSFLRLAQPADLPRGTVTAIAMELSALDAPNAGDLNAMIGTGETRRTRCSTSPGGS